MTKRSVHVALRNPACRGPRYLEVDVDVGSSQTAARVVGLVQGALKSLVIDIAVLLEGKTQVRCNRTCIAAVHAVGGGGGWHLT